MKFFELYVPRIEAQIWECELGDMIFRVLCLGNLQGLPAKTYREEGGWIFFLMVWDPMGGWVFPCGLESCSTMNAWTRDAEP